MDKPQSLSHFQLKIEQLHCASCVRTIEKALYALPGAQTVNVNFATRIVSIKGSVMPNEAILALKHAGYNAMPVDTHNHHKHQHRHEHEHGMSDASQVNILFKKAFSAGIVGLALMILSLTPWNPSLMTMLGRITWGILGLLSVFIIFYSAGHIYRGAFDALKRHTTTMDTLITIGTVAAWSYSFFVILFPVWVPGHSQHVYFEAALIIIAFVDLGAALENRARGKTSEAIRRLMSLQPKMARRLNQQGQVEEVPIEMLLVGDQIQVRPGEQIPVDGEVVEGSSTVDESMLTGEAIPAKKNKQDQVYSGTINQSGRLVLKTTEVGSDTVLARIIQFVQVAQNTKPSIARWVDTISYYFVPVVIGIALLTALIWFLSGFPVGYSVLTSMTVLIIACPCALGLATPISIIAGMGKAAEQGILIRNGDALQKASELNTIVLDKTGTITKGHPEVVNMISQEVLDETQILQYAASVEQWSSHPLAHAIVKTAQARSLELWPVTDFQEMAGQGVSARINDQTVLLGHYRYMNQCQIDTTGWISQSEALARLGQTPVWIAIDKKVKGLLAVADPIKSDSRSAIVALKRLGVRVIMLTGDHVQTAQAIAEQVDIQEVLSEVLPENKALEIQKLQMQHQRVGMVGDGINDAPALAQADVGFAMSSGTDIAMETADVTLMSNSLLSVLKTILISRATLMNIKQNLWGAFIYNLIGIPIAAGVLYSMTGILLNPMIAGFTMAASSLTVVLNANRLRFHSSSY